MVKLVLRLQALLERPALGLLLLYLLQDRRDGVGLPLGRLAFHVDQLAALAGQLSPVIIVLPEPGAPTTDIQAQQQHQDR